MCIARIKNRYMFKSKNPNKPHDYLVWTDSSTGQVRAVELTHLYEIDKYRFAQVKSGLLKKMKFRHRETPSGVNNGYVYKNINGGPIDLTHPDVNLNAYRKAYISSKQIRDILKFANKPKKRKKKKKKK